MTISVEDFLSDRIQKLMTETENRESIEEQLNESLQLTIQKFSDFLNLQPVQSRKTFSIGSVKKDSGVHFGIKRQKEKLVLGEWIFDLHSRFRIYTLYFIILKESFVHFIKSNIDEVDDAIINIITLLLLKDIFEIDTFDNPIFAALTSRIYPEEIGGKGYNYWNNLLLLLFSKEINFVEVFSEFQDIIKNESITPEEMDKNFSNWVVNKTIKEEDVVKPIYLHQKQIDVLNTVVELGHEKSTSVLVAKKMKMHQNSIRSYFRDFVTSYATIWRARINYEGLNLHNYFIKIVLQENKINDQLIQLLTKIPYLRSIFQGKEKDNLVIYSPTLLSPHLIADQLRGKLKGYQNKNMIIDFDVQLIREKKAYGTISNYPFYPSIKNFQKLIDGELENVSKLIFFEKRKDFSLEFDDTLVNLNPNILYFLSIITGRFLLKARYAIRVNELPNYYELNNVPMTDIEAQTNLIYNTEMQARNKRLLDYALFMKNFSKPGSETLVIEMKSEDEALLEKTIDDIRVFSFLGQFDLYDRKILTLSGLSHDHPISNLLQKIISERDIESNFYSVNLTNTKFLPLHELFDFDEKKWKMG